MTKTGVIACFSNRTPPSLPLHQVLENKLAEAKMKKDTLKARAQSAKSAAAINDMVGGCWAMGGACCALLGARQACAFVSRRWCHAALLAGCDEAPFTSLSWSFNSPADCGAGHQQRAGRL